MFRRQQRKHLIIQYSLTTLGKMWVQTRPKYCFFIVWLSSSTFSLGLSHTDSYWEIEKGKVWAGGAIVQNIFWSLWRSAPTAISANTPYSLWYPGQPQWWDQAKTSAGVSPGVQLGPAAPPHHHHWRGEHQGSCRHHRWGPFSGVVLQTDQTDME